MTFTRRLGAALIACVSITVAGAAIAASTTPTAGARNTTPRAATAPARAANTALPPVTAADRVLGRADAPVTVVEYASFVCTHCADWYKAELPAFKTRFIDTGKVRLVFRNLPTQPQDVAMAAAMVGKCAAPERFFDVASSFMNGQAALFAGGKTWFSDAIAVSGRTQAQIEACFDNPATRTQLEAEINGAIAAGADGTPAFFVNGTRVTDHSLEGLTAAINPLLPKR